jgi:hypothetical protein
VLELLFPDWWTANLTVLGEQLREPTFDGLLLLRYWMQALATYLPFALADYFLGLGLLTYFRVCLARPLHHAAAIGLGSGVAATGILLWGTFGRLTVRGLLLYSCLQLLLGLSLAAPALRWPRLRRGFVLSLPLLILVSFSLMMPVLDYDSTMYHMASAKHYLATGKVEYHEGIRFNAQQHLPVLLYLRQWAMSEDASLIKLVNLQFLAVHLLLFTWLARRFRIRHGAWMAAGLVFGTPIFAYVAQVEYADFALATWLGVGFAVLASGGNSGRRLALAGLLLGFAAAAKLQGLVVVACVGVAWFAVAIWHKRNLGSALRPALLIAAGIVLAGAPWWIRGYAATGSPFYPFLSDSPDVENLFKVNASYGVGRDWVTFLMTPWNMIVVPPPKYADLFPFGPSCLLLLLVGAAALLRRRSGLDAGTKTALLGSLLFTLFWFRSGQVMRYEACLLLLWAYVLLGAWARLRWPGWAGLALFFPLLIWSFVMTYNPIRFGVPPPVTWPATQVVLRSVLPYYRAAQALQSKVEDNERVYLWFCDEARFYVPGRTYGDWFGAYTYPWLGNVGGKEPIRELPALLEKLKAHGFRYVLADRQRARQMATIYGPQILSTGLVDPFAPIPGVEVIYDDHHYVAFRLP